MGTPVREGVKGVPHPMRPTRAILTASSEGSRRLPAGPSRAPVPSLPLSTDPGCVCSLRRLQPHLPWRPLAQRGLHAESLSRVQTGLPPSRSPRTEERARAGDIKTTSPQLSACPLSPEGTAQFPVTSDMKALEHCPWLCSPVSSPPPTPASGQDILPLQLSCLARPSSPEESPCPDPRHSSTHLFSHLPENQKAPRTQGRRRQGWARGQDRPACQPQAWLLSLPIPPTVTHASCEAPTACQVLCRALRGKREQS